MINLIKVERMRLMKQRALPLLVLFAAYLSFAIVSTAFEKELPVGSMLSEGRLTFAGSFYTHMSIFLPVILAGFFLGSDFSNRTLQLQIANGHRRLHIILAKTLVYSTSALLLMALVPLFNTLVITGLHGWGADFTADTLSYIIRTVILVFVLNIGSVSLYVPIAFLCKDTSKTLIISAVVTLLYVELGGILSGKFSAFEQLYQYVPMQQIAVVVQEQLSGKELFTAVLSGCITWLICILPTVYFFNRQDLS